MAKIKEPTWKAHDLWKLRETAAYRAGRGNRRVTIVTAEDRAAYDLGKSEAALSRNFNAGLFGKRR